MHIDWVALGSVFGVSLVVTVALVGLFALGVVVLSRREPTAARGSTVLAVTGAYACFALCAAAVAYGILLIVA